MADDKRGYKDGLAGRSLNPPRRVSIPLICVDTRTNAEMKVEQDRYVKQYEIGQRERLAKAEKDEGKKK